MQQLRFKIKLFLEKYSETIFTLLFQKKDNLRTDATFIIFYLKNNLRF